MDKNDPYFDYDLLDEIKDMACANIEELLTSLGVDFRRNGKMIVGPCPVHGGDNLSAWNLYPEGEDVPESFKSEANFGFGASSSSCFSPSFAKKLALSHPNLAPNTAPNFFKRS